MNTETITRLFQRALRAALVALLLAAALLASGCTKDITDPELDTPEKRQAALDRIGEMMRKEAEQAVAFSLKLAPLEAYINTNIAAEPVGFPIMPDMKENRLVWYLNGRGVNTTQPFVLKPSEVGAKKGDIINAVAYVGENTQVVSESVTIKNTPPLLTEFRLRSERITSDEDVWVESQTFDADGDSVTVEYQWVVNGSPVSNREKAGIKLQRGDTYYITAKPFDGESYGQEKKIDSSVRNMMPVIARTDQYTFDGTTYTYKATATDPDNDPITFGLKDAPAGMSIDPLTGVVTWTVPANFFGTIKYSVTATDNNGGQGYLPVTFTLEPTR